MKTSGLLTKRQLKTADKRERIYRAASVVFAERGYQSATTQEIAEVAGIGAGTLFRYVATKAELLLWVGSELLNVPPPPSTPEPLIETVGRVLKPLFDLAGQHPENFAAYQRELMFGPPGDYRDAALQGIVEMEVVIGTALRTDLGGQLPRGISVAEAGRSFMSMLFIELVRVCMQVETRTEVEELLPVRLQIFRDGLAAQLTELGE